MTRIEEIKEREAKATLGPWKNINSTGMTGVHSTGEHCKIYHSMRNHICSRETFSRQKHDAAFISHSREDIPYLLAEVEKLREGMKKFPHMCTSHPHLPCAGCYAQALLEESQ